MDSMWRADDEQGLITLLKCQHSASVSLGYANLLKLVKYAMLPSHGDEKV